VSLPFLLEIGTEEIPDWMIIPALNQLLDMFQGLLDQNSLGGKVTSADATPRRLVLQAAGLVEKQSDTEELILGPPKSAGQGAAAGFAKKMSTTPDQLRVESTSKGEYFAFTKRSQGQATAAILARELPNLILKIQWPKTMYWNGKGTERFIRPIRWLVALLGSDVVPFEIAGVRSGRESVGHRILGKPSFPLTVENFAAELEANGVILSASQRRKKIEADFASLLDSKGLKAKPDPDLLHTLTYITEFPSAILGDFDSQYLELPQEVLVTVMRHHQKYLSVEDRDGNLAPHFIAVMNTAADPDGLVRHGNERVLRARFNDARFFWEHDNKRKLEDRLEDLKNVTFQAKVGSYYDKTQRVIDLALRVSQKILNVESNAVERAARLCKCDLTTDMVKEFTDLQGIVGGLYARAQGEPAPVWRAIYDHYKPVGSDDAVPSTIEGRVLAVADKLDTLRECFQVGLAPTGSKDPFALRRAAQGVVRICVEGKLDLWPADTEVFGQSAGFQEFLLDRVRHYFREVKGFKYDEVNFALHSQSLRDLPDIESRLEAFCDVRQRRPEDFRAIAGAFKRIRNILVHSLPAASIPRKADLPPGVMPVAVDETLLEPGAERELYSGYDALRDQVYLFAGRRQYVEALEAIASLRPNIDRFFDTVLVNVDDPKVRQNRFSLLLNLLTEFSEIGDFSEIVTERHT
jgi:glycyl-tRNA synthetase beta chain